MLDDAGEKTRLRGEPRPHDLVFCSVASFFRSSLFRAAVIPGHGVKVLDQRLRFRATDREVVSSNPKTAGEPLLGSRVRTFRLFYY